MRKLIFGILLGLLAVSALLVACGENDTKDYAEDLYGSWDKGEDTFEYRADGKIYKNGNVLHRFEVKEEGKIRVYDKTDKELYSTYHFSVDSTGNVLTMDGVKYYRTGTHRPDNEDDGEAGDVTDKENNDNENDGDYSDGETDKDHADTQKPGDVTGGANGDGVIGDADNNHTGSSNDNSAAKPGEGTNGTTDGGNTADITDSAKNGTVGEGMLGGMLDNGIR